MRVAKRNLTGNLFGLGLVSVALCGCGQSADGGTTGTEGGAGGTVSNASGGTTSSATSTGGTVSTGGSIGVGGTVATGGSKATGGAPGTGGTTVLGSGGGSTGGTVGAGGSTGGTPATGGSTARGGSTGTGGGTASTGGSIAQGGKSAGGSNTGGVGKGGSGTGGGLLTGGTTTTGGSTVAAGGTTTGCQKGLVKAQEVVIMGESFYAIAPQYIQKRIEEKAKAAGAIGASDTYRNVAVSGQTMNYIATTEWNNAVKSTTKVVIMDGGGIDCMSSSCASCPGDFTTLLGKMATAGVEDVIYTRYPEPGAPPGSNATLKANLDILMPKMQPVCEGSTKPRCHWVDLRPVWQTGDTTDGLHPTQSGGNHVGDAIWAEMVTKCIAQ